LIIDNRLEKFRFEISNLNAVEGRPVHELRSKNFSQKAKIIPNEKPGAVIYIL
jgi:hypothetical protein